MIRARTLLPVVALAAAFVPAAPARTQEVHVPDFEVQVVVNLPATKNPMRTLRGRLVLLEFFGPWSDKCVEMVPHLNRLEQELGGQGLSVLAVAEGEKAAMEKFVTDNAVAYAVAGLDTLGYEALSNAVSVPGMPHAVLVAPDGTIAWKGHPGYLKAPAIKEHLGKVQSPPVRVPEPLASVKPMLDDGRWAEARTATQAALAGLDKVSKAWAEGLVTWIETRRATWLSEAAAFETSGRFWDAWSMYADFARRFAGMEGVDDATAKATALRSNKDAAADLAAGDDVAKARDFLANNKKRQAELILQRVLKTAKGTVHAERAKELLDAAK